MGITVSNSNNNFSVRVGKPPAVVPTPVQARPPSVNPVLSPILEIPVNIPQPAVGVDIRIGPKGEPGSNGAVGPAGATGGGGGGSTPYDVITDVVSGTLAYVGKANIGSVTSASVWQIQKLVTDVNGGVTLQWAGLAAFNQVWDNRASLTYA